MEEREKSLEGDSIDFVSFLILHGLVNRGRDGADANFSKLVLSTLGQRQEEMV